MFIITKYVTGGGRRGSIRENEHRKNIHYLH